MCRIRFISFPHSHRSTHHSPFTMIYRFCVKVTRYLRRPMNAFDAKTLH